MTQNYFELFGLEAMFGIDQTLLEINYRHIQSESHPDRFVTGTPTEKLKSMQLATLANEAYQTLKSPANRAAYFLTLKGITTITETNTAMPSDFLMQQMEWREAIEDAKVAKNMSAIDDLLTEIKQEAKALNAELISAIDTRKDYGAATKSTRKLIFMDKLTIDINKVIELIEN